MASFAEKLISIELLGQKDIDDIRRAAEEFRKLYNSQAYDDAIDRIQKDRGSPAGKRAAHYLDLCNKWSCRIGGSVREEVLKAIAKAEGLVWEIDRTLEQIERADYALIIEPVELLTGTKGLGITSNSKILSLAKPDLYVMIDQAICYELGGSSLNSVGNFN
jgi:hypothetical protein